MKALKLGLFFSLFLIIASCGKDDESMTTNPTSEQPSLYEMIAADPALSKFSASLVQTGLNTTLTNPGNYTVFAPTDKALSDQGIDLQKMTPQDLNTFISNHIIEKNLPSYDMTTSYVKTMAIGPENNNLSMFIHNASDIVLNGDAELLADQKDLMAANGVLHYTSKAIKVPSVTDHGKINPEYSLFAEAILLLEDYLPYLLGIDEDQPFTVFAPTNEAFMATIDLMGFDALGQIPLNTLMQILLYHISIEGNLDSGSLEDGQMIEMVMGGSIIVDLSDGVKIIDGTPQPANVVMPDIQADNGVLHSIDKVLIPMEVAQSIGENSTIAQLLAINGDFSTLNHALRKTGLIDLLADPSAELTLFAPNNAAFAAFFDQVGMRYEDVPLDLLTNILLNHVVSRSVLSKYMKGGFLSTNATTPEGPFLDMAVFTGDDGKVKINNSSTIVYPDINTKNGLVHVVDAVIGLPTVADFLLTPPPFRSMVAALSTVESEAMFIKTLQTPWGTPPAPFTVFAPSNQAFSDLLEELMVSSLEDIPTETLITTLSYHIIPGTTLREPINYPLEVATIEGGVITISVVSGGRHISTSDDGRITGVVQGPFRAINGVLFTTNKVILPPQD